MATFEPIPPEDQMRAGQILGYAFTPATGPDHEPPDASQLFELWGHYDSDEDENKPETEDGNGDRGGDKRLCGTCKLYEPAAWVRGEQIPIGGLGAVAVPPERRRRGHARSLCRGAVETYRDRGIGLVALWPFATSFYRQLGWATANEVRRYDCEPTVFARAETVETDRGTLQRLTVEDWERLSGVETSYGQSRSLALSRSERWWRERTFADWDGGGRPYCYGYVVDGRLRGYLLYTVEDDQLSVQDLVYADGTAREALFGFLGGHGAQIERIVLRRTADSDLLYRLDPDGIETTVSPGPMVRLTDPTGLETIPWPAVDIEETLAVTDPLFEDGIYRLSVTDGTATVSERSVREANDPTATVDIGTLSQLAVGTHGVDRAAELGGLTTKDPDTRDALAELFRTQPVGLREFF